MTVHTGPTGPTNDMDRSFTDQYEAAFDGRAYLNSLCQVFEGKLPPRPYYRKDKVEFQLNIFKDGEIRGRRLLEVGCGPCVDFCIVPCPYFDEIYLSDINESCRKEVDLWRKKSPEAFDISGYFKYITQMEGCGSRWEARQDELLSKIKGVLACDVLLSNPLEPHQVEPFDCIITSGCIHCACTNKKDYVRAVQNVISLLKPGGHYVSFAPLGHPYYKLSGKIFSMLDMDEHFLKQSALEAGLQINKLITKYLEKDPRVESGQLPPMAGYAIIDAVRPV